MSKYYQHLIAVLVLYLITPISVAANIGWLPNLVHYINNSQPLSTPLPELPLDTENFLDNSTLNWANFGGEGFIYTLEFQLEGSNEWVQLYQGESSHFYSSATLASGTYTFRVNCSGVVGCPAEGYITNTIDIVQKPAYVNAEYDHDTQNVHVYWSDLQQIKGYTVEQTADNGVSWQAMSPDTETGEHYEGENYSGQVHTKNNVVLSNTSVNQGIQAAKAIQKLKIAKANKKIKNNAATGSSTPNVAEPTYQVGSTLQYRVKACSIPSCGENEHSQTLAIVNLKELMPDPTFESGNVQFSEEVWSTVGSTLNIDSQTPINQSKSLSIKLSNYAFTYYVHNYQKIHNYDPTKYPILNGLTLKGKLRINSLSKDSKISVYPVAYYEGWDRRIEGQKQEFSVDDIGKELTLKSQVWLNSEDTPENKVKRAYFLIRLIGEGEADLTLDDAHLYEGSGLAQTDPTLSSYISNYNGVLKHSWTQFAENNSTYHLEVREEKQNEWTTYYRGIETAFHNENVNMPTGIYHFRMLCTGAANCPEDGYIRATTVVAREPAYITVKVKDNEDTTVIDWANTVSSYGYALEKSTNGGATWVNIAPRSDEPQRNYTAAQESFSAVLFTESSTIQPGIAASTDLFRVKACRWGRCGNFRTSTAVYDFNSAPEKVSFFTVDKPNIKPGESVSLDWGRPANYSSDYIYNIYVAKPNSDGYPKEERFLWQSSLKIHAITRGGATGIQRVGTQYLDIEVCNAAGVCSERQTPSEEVSITVDGPPPMPWIFNVDKPEILKGDTITLNWAMHHNYQEPVTYNLFVRKPYSSSDYEFASDLSQNSFDRLINKAGTHTFYAQACKIAGEVGIKCGDELASLTVTVLGVMQDAMGNLYLQLSSGSGGGYLKLALENGSWVVTNLTPEEWALITLTDTSYTFEFIDFSNDGIIDLKLTNGTDEILMIQNLEGEYKQSLNRSIIFIHTDILGTPIAETDSSGNIN